MTRQNDIIEKIDKPVVLIGLMGVGKTKIGSAFAAKLGLPFEDADEEIVKSAGCSIADIFELYGETAFRDLEEKVITRLIGKENSSHKKVVSLGGGAVMNPSIASLVWDKALSIWLVAELGTMVERTSTGVQVRPLLEKGDPSEILKELMEKRYSTYQNANIHIHTDRNSVKDTITEILKEIDQYYA